MVLKIAAYCIGKCTARYVHFQARQRESLRMHVCIYLQIESHSPSGAIMGDRLAMGRNFCNRWREVGRKERDVGD